METIIILVGWVIAIICALIYNDYEFEDASRQFQHEQNMGIVWISAIVFGFFVGYFWLLGIIVILIKQKINK
jgi:hypothetical protein